LEFLFAKIYGIAAARFVKTSLNFIVAIALEGESPRNNKTGSVIIPDPPTRPPIKPANRFARIIIAMLRRSRCIKRLYTIRLYSKAKGEHMLTVS